MKVSLTKYASLDCQRVFKRPADATQKTCPRCSGVTYRTGSDFRPPSAEDKRGVGSRITPDLKRLPVLPTWFAIPGNPEGGASLHRKERLYGCRHVDKQDNPTALAARSSNLMACNGPKRPFGHRRSATPEYRGGLIIASAKLAMIEEFAAVSHESLAVKQAM